MKLTTHLHLALRLMSGFIPPAHIRLHSVHTDIVNLFETSFALQKPLSLSHASCRLYHFFFYWRYNPLWICILQPCSRAIASSRTRFFDHTQRRPTVGRTPLDE